jgi:hypothetical protein
MQHGAGWIVLQRFFEACQAFFLIKAKTPVQAQIEQSLRISANCTHPETMRTQIKI